MPRLRHTVEQILAKLREAEVALSKGQPVAQVCRTHGITEQTYYRWRDPCVNVLGAHCLRRPYAQLDSHCISCFYGILCTSRAGR